MGNDIVGLWTLPVPTVIEACRRAGITVPDWVGQAKKVSVRTDEHGITFIGRGRKQ